MKRNRKAKILATLGPASSSSDIIESLFKVGCDVFRLNFSHGSVETHRQNLESIRALEKKYDHASCILADLQGPKLRVGEFKNTEESLKKGQKFILDTNSVLGDDKRVNFPHSEIYDHLTPNTTLLINDGRIRLQVIEQHKNQLITEVLNDGVISNNKGVNIPDIILPIDSMTNKDRADLQKALEMNVDWVALSFVQQSEDIIKLKKIVDGKAMIMAKIEKPSAVKNIDDIIKVADGIMIARGDLGVEMPTEKVPIVQKNIIKRCRHFGKPVVVATQMLESMISNLVPTRAEASDVANAIYDGTDAVMLSGESAVGHYPLESVSTMNNIIENVEKDKNNFNLEIDNLDSDRKIDNTDAITNAAYSIANNAGAKAIITFSVSGKTTMRMARERAPVQIIGLSPNIKTARKMQIIWGVNSCYSTKDAANTTEMVNIACSVVKNKNLVKADDSVIITAGVPFGNAGSTNLLRIAKIIDDKDLT
ncbi:pyruvate kinase [Pelagibacterales bacterium SAG-MED31]|nr:pyruvate kinase [Pelagibacterales bacterium SAG-MED31]